MLEEFRGYENLGTPKFFYELCIQLHERKVWTHEKIHGYFFNRIIDDRYIFDGCLPLAIYIGLVIEKNERLKLNPDFVNCLQNERNLAGYILKKFLETCQVGSIIFDIFCPEYLSYDIVYHSIQITNSAFGFKYANIKQFLIDFKFLIPHPDSYMHKYIINSAYKQLFDKLLLPQIKNKKMGINALYKALEQKQINGEQAELFVLAYEKVRLGDRQDVLRVSEYNISAGYDILSYDNCESKIADRFIEVKSYSKNIYFYRSRNEINIAKLKKENYYLYLVDRDKIHQENYIPEIISNPYENVLQNEHRQKDIDKYLITKII